MRWTKDEIAKLTEWRRNQRFNYSQRRAASVALREGIVRGLNRSYQAVYHAIRGIDNKDRARGFVEGDLVQVRPGLGMTSATEQRFGVENEMVLMAGTNQRVDSFCGDDCSVHIDGWWFDPADLSLVKPAEQTAACA